MASKDKAADGKSALRVVELLLKAAEGDTAFRDLYLQRAAGALEKVMPEREYRSLCGEQARADALLRQVQGEVRSQNWDRVKQLSAQVELLRQTARDKAEALALAEAVYDADEVRIDPFSPGLRGFALPPGQTLASLHQGLVAALGDLAKADPEWADLYGERQRRVAAKPVSPEAPAGDKPAAAATDLSELRRQAEAAAERGDAAALQRLAEQITQASAKAPEERASPAAEQASEALGSVAGAVVSTEPFPAASVERAAKLGFEQVRTAEQSPEMPKVLADFLARHAWQPGHSAQDLAKEGTVHLRDRLSGLDLPPEIKGPAVEMAALFSLHPFINSCGVRYFSAGAGEYVLLETFPEDAEPAPDAEILSLLGLKRRRGLARVEIEEALRRHGRAVLQERLGLDPREFRIVCLPYDVYVRAGMERGWGNQPQWTHVDGYAVGRGGRLGALAAGHVRYGGLFDLVILDRTDQRENVTARFCVVRRARFLPAAG